MYFTSAHNKNPYILATSTEEIDTGKRGSDRVLLSVVIMLMMIGLLAVYSAIAYFAETKGLTAGSLLMSHVIKLIIAFMVLLIFSKIDYHILLRYSKIALLMSWVFLLAVIIFGSSTFGAKRSLDIGSFSFQPSSFASVALLIQVAALLTQKQDYIKDFKRSFLPILFWVLITCGLIGVEDYSTAALLLGTCLLLMLVGRISILHLGGLIILGILGSFLLFNQNPEREKRIDNYINQVVHIESAHFALNEGYQAQQSQIAIARGEVFGVGMGKSSQRDFLPAPYNDFIFSIITEEYGLIGAGFILFLYCIILFRGIVYIAKRSLDTAGTLIAVACTLSISLYAFVNAAVATGLFPVTGLPMPFVSYGGTSMLFAGSLIGILLNISKYKRAGT
ncbi:MAG TPA: FtsW/RodA/SpoVE family cell cycle protein [Balneolales bacterium]|nr:FtsW/RodA/SpoVE family cell cycle protein [Balneolales bacterium]